jgi:hypothetical protein
MVDLRTARLLPLRSRSGIQFVGPRFPTHRFWTHAGVTLAVGGRQRGMAHRRPSLQVATFASSASARLRVTTRGVQSIGQQLPAPTRVMEQSASVEQSEASAAIVAAAASLERCAQPSATRQSHAMSIRWTMHSLRLSVEPCAAGRR